MPKRSHEDVWQQLVDEAGEDEIDRAASVSVVQAEKELAKAGFDVAAERAKANAIIDQIEASERVSGQISIANKPSDQGSKPSAQAKAPAPVAPIRRLRRVFAFAALVGA